MTASAARTGSLLLLPSFVTLTPQKGMALAGLTGIDGSKQCPPETKWMRLRIWFALHYCCRWDIAKYQSSLLLCDLRLWF